MNFYDGRFRAGAKRVRNTSWKETRERRRTAAIFPEKGHHPHFSPAAGTTAGFVKACWKELTSFDYDATTFRTGGDAGTEAAYRPKAMEVGGGRNLGEKVSVRPYLFQGKRHRRLSRAKSVGWTPRWSVRKKKKESVRRLDRSYIKNQGGVVLRGAGRGNPRRDRKA